MFWYNFNSGSGLSSGLGSGKSELMEFIGFIEFVEFVGLIELRVCGVERRRMKNGEGRRKDEA